MLRILLFLSLLLICCIPATALEIQLGDEDVLFNLKKVSLNTDVIEKKYERQKGVWVASLKKALADCKIEIVDEAPQIPQLALVVDERIIEVPEKPLMQNVGLELSESVVLFRDGKPTKYSLKTWKSDKVVNGFKDVTDDSEAKRLERANEFVKMAISAFVSEHTIFNKRR